MQLDTFYCETVGGVFCATNNSFPSMRDFKAAEKGSSEIMSVSGDRKRKYINNSGSNERETRNEHSRQSSIRTQQRQRSEESSFVENDQRSTTKKSRGRRFGRTAKNDKTSGKFHDEELSNGEEELTKNSADCYSLCDKINFSASESDKEESEVANMEEVGNEGSDCQTDIEAKVVKGGAIKDDETYHGIHQNSASIANDKEDTNDSLKEEREFDMKSLTISSSDEKNPSPNHDLTEKVKTVCDDSNNISKKSVTPDNGNSFSIEKICDSTPLYEMHQNEANVDSNHTTTLKQLSPLYNEDRLPINNNDERFEPAPNTPIDGCVANSKFSKFPNNEHETNIESECDTPNERITQKDNYQIPEEIFNYKQEDKNNDNESKTSECLTPSWETVNRNQSYSNDPEACCFGVTEAGSNLENNLPGQTQETKTSQLDLYTEPLQQSYGVHQQHQRQKESTVEDFQNENEIINRKAERDQLTKLQSEQQIQQHDFEHLSLPNTERQQHQSQHDHYRQFQPHDQQSSYEQMFETEQRGQQVQSEQQNQEHSQQYTQEQFYQMRLQQQHHLGQVMPLMPQHHPNLQDSLQEEHLMAYLHHQAAMVGAGQQSRLQQDIYQDLMMDEFHEDANAATYKLRHLSPTTAKHENQDDGYETSAGDVLTPNSHSSSTHSGTPQLPVSLHAPTSSLALQNVASATNCATTSDQQHNQMQQPQGTNGQSSCGTRNSESFNQDSTVNISQDPYKFTGNSNACLSEKVERLFPMQSDQSNQLNHGLTATQTMHGEGLNSIKSDINDVIASKDGLETLVKPPQKRRGRKKKVPIIEGMSHLQSSNMINAAGLPNATDTDGTTGLMKVKERKKHDRFNGMSEEEVVKRTLPDHLCHNLDIVIIGINPGLFAAYKGHHYAGPGNHFWKCLYLSGLTQEQMSADEDYKLMKCGIGFTNMVQRATKGSADLTRKEIKEGSRILLEKLQRFQPKIAVFNGKLIFEVFSGKKDFNFGRQPECVEGTNTYVWVMPSSSARCAQLPRAADKVPFYAALKKFRDYLTGLIPQIDEEECVFTEQRIRQMCEQEQLKNLAQSHSTCSYGNATGCPPTSVEQEHQSRDYSAYSNSDSQLNSGAVNVSEGTVGGPGPPTMVSHGSGYLVPSNFSGPPHPTPEKKKRGRPKKLRVQEIIDPNTGQKIQITNAQHHQQSNVNNDFNNILNLSMMSAEVPKKKRGRPKKVKTLPAEIHGSGIGENSSALLPSKQTQNPSVAQQSQQISLYNNPPSTGMQQQIFGPSSASPNHSPALNSSTVGVNGGSVYTPSSNLTSAQMTPPTNDTSGEMSSKPHLSESTPPPSSPNICSVDFEPPSNPENRSQGELHSQQMPTNIQQRSRFEAPHVMGVDSGTNESFQQWMSPSHQYNYQPSLQQENQQQYQAEHNLSIHHRPQKQSHENHSQQSPQSPWATSIRNQHFESNESNHQRQHYMNAMHANTQQHQQQLQQHEPQQSQLHHQSAQHPTDVATKSLSGLESLVDQIPTIAESEAAAAAVESRLQTLQRGSTPASFGDLQADTYEGNLLSENRGPSSLGNPTSLSEANNDAVATSRNSSNGSNTPHFGVSSVPACASPINHYGLQRHGQTTSAASSPHAHAPYSGSISGGATFPLNSSTSQHSPSVASELLTNSHTPPTMANSSTTTTNSSTTTSHHLFSNFSVSHLAASSVPSCNSNNANNNNKTSDWQSSGARSPYHHPNLMAAAALQLHTAASSSSPTANPPHQMYIDPHTSIHHHPHHSHLSSPHQHHVQVNSLYSSSTQAAHPHHHPGMAVAYGAPPTSQHPSHHVHNASGDYGAYGATAAAAAAAHMLHMPNPNYSPYGYGTAPPPPVPTASTQNTYSSWNHHGHPTAASHHPHHLSMFERLKPSDIGSYSSF